MRPLNPRRDGHHACFYPVLASPQQLEEMVKAKR
jgi:hypothetical protein